MLGGGRRKRLSRVKHNIVHVGGAGCGALRRGHLALVDRRRVVPSWIEVRKLVDAVEHFRNELTKIQPWRDSSATAQPSSDAAREIGDVAVIDGRPDPRRVLGLLRENVADPAANRCK